eukprot:248703_1
MGEVYELCFLIFGVLSSTLCMGLLIIHCAYYYQHEWSSNNAQKPSKFPRVVSILTLFTLLGYAINVTQGTISHFTCTVFIDKLSPLIYQSAKCCMYLIFILRIYYVYNQSIYAINIIFLQIYAIILIVIYLSLSFYGYFAGSNHKNSVVLLGYYITACTRHHGDWFLFISLSMDAINTILTIIAFITPLRKIMNSLKQKYRKNFNNENLKYPIIKISILTLFASITSILSHIISILTKTNVAFTIDIPINALCIMLMTSYYPKLYKRLCFVCITLISLFDKTKDIEENMEQQIDKNRGNNDIKMEETNCNTATLGISLRAIKFDIESTMSK